MSLQLGVFSFMNVFHDLLTRATPLPLLAFVNFCLSNSVMVLKRKKKGARALKTYRNVTSSVFFPASSLASLCTVVPLSYVSLNWLQWRLKQTV